MNELRRPRASFQPSMPPPHPRQASRSRLIDDIKRVSPPSRSPAGTRPYTPQPSPPPVTSPRIPDIDAQVIKVLQRPVAADMSLPHPKKKRLMHTLFMPATVPLLLAGAALGPFGHALAGLYGGIALLVKMPANTTFSLIIVSLVCMIGLQILNFSALAKNLADLTFDLFVIGVISLALEVRRTPRSHEKRLVNGFEQAGESATRAEPIHTSIESLR